MGRRLSCLGGTMPVHFAPWSEDPAKAGTKDFTRWVRLCALRADMGLLCKPEDIAYMEYPMREVCGNNNVAGVS